VENRLLITIFTRWAAFLLGGYLALHWCPPSHWFIEGLAFVAGGDLLKFIVKRIQVAIAAHLSMPTK